MSAEEQSHHATPERSDVANGPILAFVAGFIVFTIVAAGGLYLYFRQSFAAPLIASPRAFPQPELQQDPQRDLARTLAKQRERLDHYAWIDKTTGTIRIPITEAMKLIAEKGPEGYGPLALPAAVPTPGSRGGAVSGASP